MVFQINPRIKPTGFPPVAETLPAAIRKIVRALNPEKIILFGSYTRGIPTPDSDVDLLVIWDTEKVHRERIIEISMLLYPRLFPLDILVMTPQEVAEALAKNNFFIREILKEGVVLYERPQ